MKRILLVFIMPLLNWDKGKAVLWLLHLENLIDPDNNLYPVYIGDDQTDEDAFESLKNHGLTVVVEQKAVSSAQYYVQDTFEVTRFLTQMADMKK